MNSGAFIEQLHFAPITGSLAVHVQQRYPDILTLNYSQARSDRYVCVVVLKVVQLTVLDDAAQVFHPPHFRLTSQPGDH